EKCVLMTHRQRKEEATDRFYLKPPRHTSTLPRTVLAPMRSYFRCGTSPALPPRSSLFSNAVPSKWCVILVWLRFSMRWPHWLQTVGYVGNDRGDNPGRPCTGFSAYQDTRAWQPIRRTTGEQHDQRATPEFPRRKLS